MSDGSLGRVAALFRYPVKTMAGESIPTARLTSLGVPGDRLWAARDERRGDFATGKRSPALMGCRAFARGEDEAPEIELPDGTRWRADDPEASARLSEVLGRRVTLLPVGANPGESADPETVADPQADFRAQMGRIEGEPDPAFPDVPPALIEHAARADRPHVDFAPLLLLSQRSIDSLADRVGEPSLDVGRFRPSLLLDEVEAAAAFPEESWVGARLRIGECLVEVGMRCPRCVMTTHGFGDVPKNPGVMRALVAATQGNLGVYASIVEEGAVRVGDPVTREATHPARDAVTREATHPARDAVTREATHPARDAVSREGAA